MLVGGRGPRWGVGRIVRLWRAGRRRRWGVGGGVLLMLKWIEHHVLGSEECWCAGSNIYPV
jgi:hypothetical protein